MASKDQGLTVGELTIAIGALLVAGLIWSSISNNENSNQSLRMQTDHISSSNFLNDHFLKS